MTAVASELRLAAVQVCGYRAFPVPIAFQLARHDGAGKPLGKGRNLLLFGENGSGKSSFGKAIRDFLDYKTTANAFDEYKYRFTEPPRTDRGVTLRFDDPAIDPLVWNPTQRDVAHREFIDMARSCGWLDYRVVRKIAQIEKAEASEVFLPLVEEIVSRCPRTLGSVETFGQAWANITAAAKTNSTRTYARRHEVDQVEESIKRFNDSLEAFLEKVQSRANELLKAFNPSTTLVLQWIRGARYSSRARRGKFSVGSIQLKLIDRGRDPLKNASEFLNEARLTAVGLCLYLAGLSESIPPRRADGSTYPRLLILDDVLLSLDMAHRSPLLDLLASGQFNDWQVLLLTHDRSWYKMAKQRLTGWTHEELFVQQVGDYEEPLAESDRSHIARARDYISPKIEMARAPDFKAAAIHLRTEFELILKRACETLQLPIPFRRNPKDVTANSLWGALQNAQLQNFPAKVAVTAKSATKEFWRKEKPTRIIPEPLRDRVSFALSWVLNPLSHSESVDRFSVELKTAPAALEELSAAVEQAIAEKQLREAIARSTLLSALVNKASSNIASA